MAHGALPVPVGEGSRVPELDGCWSTSATSSRSSRASRRSRPTCACCRARPEAAGPRTLLLADELGAGTDPDDGAALARAVIEHVAGAGSWAMITTHLGSLKRLAGEVPGVEPARPAAGAARSSVRADFQVSQTCPRCRGLGEVIERPVRRLQRRRPGRKTSRIKIKIPAGIAHGSRLRSAQWRSGHSRRRPGRPLYRGSHQGAPDLPTRGRQLVLRSADLVHAWPRSAAKCRCRPWKEKRV